MDESHYQKALDYLYSFVDHSMTRALRYSPEKFNLDRMVNLARICGNPQCAYPTVHIAGTKGKGSTAAMIASCLMAAGYRVGLYTSPHLTEYTERIQVNGVEISKDDLAALVDWIKPYASQVPEITTFELTTMLGFEFFELQHVDIAVIEVGLGGRLDATNIIDPLVSVITSLSLDHINVLGDTLEKIAFEKAGIVKSGRPVVLSPQLENARKVVAQVCNERNARLFQAGSDFTGSIITTSLTHQEILLKNTAVSGFPKYQKRGLKVRLPLLGSHQRDNAVTAFGALQIIGEYGIKVNSQQFKQGYSTVHWPGRFEILQESPAIVVDSAHNPDSAQKLRKTIDDYLPGKAIVLIFGASEDKDVEGMFKALMPGVRLVIATQSTHPRALGTDKIIAIAENFHTPAIIVSEVTQALDKAIELSGSGDAIVVTGSLFIAAAIRDYWNSGRQHTIDISNPQMREK